MKEFPTNGSPCLAEDWFVDDFVPNKAEAVLLPFFGPTQERAVRQVYRYSRALRVQDILAGRNPGPETGREVLAFLLYLGTLCEMAIAGYLTQINPTEAS